MAHALGLEHRSSPWTWLWLVCLLGGCAPKVGRPAGALLSLNSDQPHEVTPLEYRWGDTGPWREVASLRAQPPDRGAANVLHARFVVGPTTCTDPTLYVAACVYLTRAKVGTRLIEHPDCFVPLRPDEVGQPVELTFESSQHMREGAVIQACQNELRTTVARSEIDALWVAFTLLIAAAFLAVAASRGGTEARPLLSAALTCVAAGVIELEGTTTSALFVPIAPPVFRAMRDVASFMLPGALASFVAFTVPDRRRGLFIFAGLAGLSLLLALALDLFGVASLRVSSRGGTVLIGLCAVVVTLHLLRHVKTDPAARRLLVGFALATLFAMPDLLWGIGVHLVNNNFAHWGMLVLLAAMGLVVQDRFRANALVTVERLARIERLNEELRFQVESRSRELRELVGSRMVASAQDRVSGEIIGQRYRVEAMLGQGGMAQVYAVTRLSDGQRLALKVLTGHVTSVDTARFAREAELAARIRHPNLVPVVDVGLTPDGPLFVVMELIEGDSLEQWRHRFGDHQWACGVLADIARGLSAVHEAGIVHRDVKPANVLLDQGVARLADFGVARAEAGPELDPDATGGRRFSLTQTGAMVGTPRYMAPEMVQGRVASRASDLFSLGLLAFELLTGDYPFVEPPYHAVLSGRPLQHVVDASRLPEGLRAVCVRLLAEDPLGRPSLGELLAALEAR